MEIFNATQSFTLPAHPGKAQQVRQAVRALLEFHKADPITPEGDGFTFAIPTFALSSRNKPLHRFSGGTITVLEKSDDQVEVVLSARLSPMNIFGCVGAVVVGLMFAFVIFYHPETSPWWALAAAAAGPVFAYTAKDQSVTRAMAALQEAAVLSAGAET
ncbi:MAG: hypothetical protein AAGF81_05870 [Pseudomonadota bacterium]